MVLGWWIRHNKIRLKNISQAKTDRQRQKDAMAIGMKQG